MESDGRGPVGNGAAPGGEEAGGAVAGAGWMPGAFVGPQSQAWGLCPAPTET